MENIVGDGMTMAPLEAKTNIEIRDLDCLAQDSEVDEALRQDFPELGEAKVNLTPAIERGQKIAIVQMAGNLLNRGKIKIS